MQSPECREGERSYVSVQQWCLTQQEQMQIGINKTLGETSEILTKGDGEVAVKNWEEHQLCVRTSRLEYEIYQLFL